MSLQQKEAIAVDMGAMAFIPMTVWLESRNVEVKLQNALQHVEEGRRHIDKLEAQIKEQSTASTELTSLKEESKKDKEYIAKLEADLHELSSQVNSGSEKKASAKRAAGSSKSPAAKKSK